MPELVSRIELGDIAESPGSSKNVGDDMPGWAWFLVGAAAGIAGGVGWLAWRLKSGFDRF